MFARVSSYRADDAAKLVDGFGRATDPLEQLDGFAGAYFLIDDESGKAMSITLWDSEEALTTTAERAKELRRDATEDAGAIESVDHYRVALTAGKVPAAH